MSEKTGFNGFLDSFKPREDVKPGDGPPAAALKRTLKSRHLQMIAIGGSIGTGLFIGSGSALAKGGPASLLIAYGLVGVMLFCTVHALGEMAVAYPVAGSFAVYSSRFIDPAWGFAMGWNYALQWLVVLPLEIIAAAITLSYWPGAKQNQAGWVTIFLVAIVSINLFGAKGYGEAEFVFSLVKLTAIVGFIIFGIIVDCGGGPQKEYIGFRYWHDPGAFNNGFKGVCSVFVTAAFAFAGTELIGLTAAETENPRKSLPRAVKQVFWRIVLFYVTALLMIGLLVPYNSKNLLNGGGNKDQNASPFVLAIRDAGVAILPSVFNSVITMSVCSVGNSAVYASSRTLSGLAANGQAPKILGFIDKGGRPMVSMAISAALGLLCYLVAAGSAMREQAFDWMLAISGLSCIFNWGSICFAHIRFRKALKVQGRSLHDLPYRSPLGTAGSWFGLALNAGVLVAQFWTGVAPTGYTKLDTMERISVFFESYLSAPIIFMFFVSYKVCRRTKMWKLQDIDLVTDQRDVNIAELMEQDRAEKASWSTWKRIGRFFC